MDVIDKAVVSMVTLVGTWMPVATLEVRDTVYFDVGMVLFFKDRARTLLANRDDIPDTIKTDLTTFDTPHIGSVIAKYALDIGKMTQAERAQASIGRADLTSIIMAEYIIIAYGLYMVDKAGAVTEATCLADIMAMLPVCSASNLYITRSPHLCGHTSYNRPCPIFCAGVGNGITYLVWPPVHQEYGGYIPSG